MDSFGGSPSTLTKQHSVIGTSKKGTKEMKDKPNKKGAGIAESKKGSFFLSQLKDSEIDYFQNLCTHIC